MEQHYELSVPDVLGEPQDVNFTDNFDRDCSESWSEDPFVYPTFSRVNDVYFLPPAPANLYPWTQPIAHPFLVSGLRLTQRIPLCTQHSAELMSAYHQHFMEDEYVQFVPVDLQQPSTSSYFGYIPELNSDSEEEEDDEVMCACFLTDDELRVLDEMLITPHIECLYDEQISSQNGVDEVAPSSSSESECDEKCKRKRCSDCDDESDDDYVTYPKKFKR